MPGHYLLPVTPDVTIPTVVDKATVAQVLRDISLLLQLQGESGFRVRAYDMAADRIAGLPQELGPLVAEGRLESLPGIGRALAEKISELVSTGRLGYLEELRGTVSSWAAGADAVARRGAEEGGHALA